MAKKVILKINQVDSPAGNTLDIQGSMDALANHDHNANYYLKAEADTNITALDNAKPTTLAGLTDTVITSPTEGQVISWVQAENAWKNTAAPPSSLSTKTDVVLTDLQDGDTLIYDGSQWVNAPFPESGGEMPSWLRSLMTTQADGKGADSSKIVIAPVMQGPPTVKYADNSGLYTIASGATAIFTCFAGTGVTHETVTYSTKDYIYSFNVFEGQTEHFIRANVNNLSTTVSYTPNKPADYTTVYDSSGKDALTSDGTDLYLCANNLYRYSLTNNSQAAVSLGSLADYSQRSHPYAVAVSNNGADMLFSKGSSLNKLSFASSSTSAFIVFGQTKDAGYACSDGINSWRGQLKEAFSNPMAAANRESFDTGAVDTDYLTFVEQGAGGHMAATGYKVFTHGGKSSASLFGGTWYDKMNEHSVDSGERTANYSTMSGIYGNISTCG